MARSVKKALGVHKKSRDDVAFHLARKWNLSELWRHEVVALADRTSRVAMLESMQGLIQRGLAERSRLFGAGASFPGFLVSRERYGRMIRSERVHFCGWTIESDAELHALAQSLGAKFIIVSDGSEKGGQAGGGAVMTPAPEERLGGSAGPAARAGARTTEGGP